MSDSIPHLGAGAQRLLEESLGRVGSKLDRRERIGNRFFAGGFLLVALAIAGLRGGQEVSPLLAAAFVIAFAVMAGVVLWGDAVNGTALQIVFVPMLLLLPAEDVPLLAAAGLVLARAVVALRGRAALGRSVLAMTDAWFSVGPVAVLLIARPDGVSLSHWPIYIAALGAQLLADGAVTLTWVWICQGVRPRDQWRDIAMCWRVDVLLFPVGVLAACAAADRPAAALLVLPLGWLLSIFSRERETHMRQSLELGRAYRGTALLLRDLLEEDDEYTGRHTEDVVGLSVRVAERMELGEDDCRATELGALLHDIGKIAVPSEIINKPGPLDDAEWAIMKTHTVEGERMLAQVGGLLADVGLVVRASHERWDGRGYPDGLAGEAIPVAARVISACDAFNAMTTDRSYRKALPLAVAVKELRDNAGTQFDPAVVDALIDVAGTAPEPTAEPGWELAVAPAADPSALPAPAPRPA